MTDESATERGSTATEPATEEGSMATEPASTAGATAESTEAGSTGTASTGEAAATIPLSGNSCCGVYGEVDGESYLFVLMGASQQSNHPMLKVIQVGDGDEAGSEVGSLEAPTAIAPMMLLPPSRIALVDGVIYAPLPSEDKSGGLWVVDVSDPTAPEQIALVETELPPISVVASGDLAAVATMSFSGPLLVFDISDPSNVTQVSEVEYSVGTIPAIMELANSYVYIVDSGGVSIFDLSTPEAAKKVAVYENPNWEGPPTIEGTASPGETGMIGKRESVAPPGAFTDIVVMGDHLYIGTADHGLQVIDVSDPANPEKVGQLELDGAAWLVAASDDQVYVVEANWPEDQPLSFAVQVVDASDPANLEIAETIDVAGVTFPPQSMIVSDDALYLVGTFDVRVLPLE